MSKSAFRYYWWLIHYMIICGAVFVYLGRFENGVHVCICF